MPETREGGCLCGAIRYRVAGEPVARTLCHCRSCRRAACGVTVAWAVFPAGDVAFTKGAPCEYGSSPGIFWGFCGDCGSLVAYRRDSRPEHRDITTATLDDPDSFPPTVEIWTEQKIGWEALNHDIPNKPRSSLNE
jgi:hypothetical protein